MASAVLQCDVLSSFEQNRALKVKVEVALGGLFINGFSQTLQNRTSIESRYAGAMVEIVLRPAALQDDVQTMAEY